MSKLVVLCKRARFVIVYRNITLTCCRSLSVKVSNKTIEESYKVLKIPLNSGHDVVREAFLRLAKKYHPDSGTPEANIDKFVAIEHAFRILTKHITGKHCKEEVENIVYDIRHTAPQHRQYLSYEGVGYGTPFQRQKQWAQSRAQKAAENVLEHRLAKALVSDNTLMKKGQSSKKHDIKTKYGFDRLVEDLIQESMSKGEFENLSGLGKPLKNQNHNPYVDFTTHKLNQVLINNGFTPEWILLNKEIDEEIQLLKEEIKNERKFLGPHPLSPEDEKKWQRIYEMNKELARSINCKINTYNIKVPLIQKQKFHVDFDTICDDILKNGPHSIDRQVVKIENKPVMITTSDDLLSILFKSVAELFSFKKKKKDVDRDTDT